TRQRYQAWQRLAIELRHELYGRRGEGAEATFLGALPHEHQGPPQPAGRLPRDVVTLVGDERADPPQTRLARLFGAVEEFDVDRRSDHVRGTAVVPADP